MKLLSNVLALIAFVVSALFCVGVYALEIGASALAPAGGRVPLIRSQAGYLLLDCPPLLNVAASSKATVRLDNLIGYSVDRIILELGGTVMTKALMSSVKLYANEKVIFDDTGDQIDKRMAYRGITANAAYLTLDFSEIRARTIVGQHAGAIDTISSKIAKLQLEIDIGAATAPTVAAFAMLSAGGDADPNYGKLIAKVLKRTFNPGGAGEFAFDFSYAKTKGSFVKRVHLFGSTVTAARVKKNGNEIWKATSARNSYIETEFLRTPQTNVVTIDFMVDGNQSEALPLENAQSMEWYVTASGAGNITVVVELLDFLENN